MKPSEKIHTFDRRALLTLGSVGALVSLISTATSAAAPLRLVLVHGRGQQGLDPARLKAEWLDALSRGAQTFGRVLPNEIDVAFPFYGDTLDRFAREFDVPLTSEIHTRGSQVDDEFLVFQAEVAQALRQRAGVTDIQVDEEYGPNPKPKGPLNWEWVQAILRALDKHGGGMS